MGGWVKPELDFLFFVVFFMFFFMFFVLVLCFQMLKKKKYWIY